MKSLLSYLLAALIASSVLAAAPDPDSKQAATMKKYTELLRRSPQLQAPDYAAYYQEVVDTAKEAGRESQTLFAMLLVEFVTPRLKKETGDRDAWVAFVRDETTRRLASAGNGTQEREFLYDIEGLFAMNHAREGGVTPEKLREFEKVMQRTYAEFPENSGLGSLEDRYLGMLENFDLKATKERATRLASNKNERVAQVASGWLARAKSKEGAMEMKFTALDGREVDLAKLRGKVVLVDFWATWCGPCVAELPNLKRVYEKYHDQGFEVVGVTLENAEFRPNDTKEEQANKLEKARAKLAAYVADKGLAWPQYYDGTYWKNPFSTKYGIRGIPAMFLLDKTSKLVDTNARGEKLEPAVKKLLES